MILLKTKFPFFIGMAALLIALCAACFSVYGIGSLFAGASISAMIMASSLEVGKLVATTFLYRYWNKTVGLVKGYLTIAVIALMIITSAGIFGFLSSAYQKSSLDFKLSQDRIASSESSKGFYTNQVGFSEDRIKVLNDTRRIQEFRLSEALTNTFLARNPIQLQQIQQQTIKMVDQANEDIKIENSKIEEARSKIQSIDEKVNLMKTGSNEKKDIQTFKFLADALHTDLDTVAKWFIVSLIFVFDPLAIALILAYNVAVYRKEDESVLDVPPTETPKKEKVEIVKPVEATVVEESIRHTNKDAQPIIEEKLNVQEEIPSKEITLIPRTNIQSVDVPPLIPAQFDDYYKRMFKH